MTRRRKRWFLIAAAVAPVALFFLSAAALVYDGLTCAVGTADVAIVLGNTVLPDGRPSARLKARLDRALELYDGGLANRIIVSGGVGTEGHDEAEVMKRYLLGHGVPADRVHADSAGTTTLLTARNAERFMAENGMASAIVVSQYFHLPRARMTLRRCGVPTVYGACPDYFELRDVYAVAREVVAFYVYLLRFDPYP